MDIRTTVTKYASKKTSEFFAEAFAMYEHGEELPKPIKDLMEETIKNGIL